MASNTIRLIVLDGGWCGVNFYPWISNVRVDYKWKVSNALNPALSSTPMKRQSLELQRLFIGRWNRLLLLARWASKKDDIFDSVPVAFLALVTNTSKPPVYKLIFNAASIKNDCLRSRTDRFIEVHFDRERIDIFLSTDITIIARCRFSATVEAVASDIGVTNSKDSVKFNGKLDESGYSCTAS